MCARCHGDQGQGTEDHCPDPLHGDRSLDDLTEVIVDTMPEEDPEQCTGDAARRVAEYLYESFYTEQARAGDQPPRIELSRMTNRQYRQAVADLIGSFVGPSTWDASRGIRAEYYNAKSLQRNRLAIERTDPRIEFDFGSDSPGEKLGKDEFSIQWQGGLIAEETGEYEICLRTNRETRLWLNDSDKPLIDASVVSGDKPEIRESIHLLGGRVYPIRVEFRKTKAGPAAIALCWKPPHRVEQVIPRRNLSPKGCPPVLAVSTDFPADDSSVGYERGAAVSQQWDQATTQAAIEVANAVVKQLPAIAKTEPSAADAEKRLRAFAYTFAERAFRRPLTDEQKRFFVDRQFADAADPESAIKRIVLLVLKSPRFLYTEWGRDQVDDYDVASRLSFGLWDSLPDETLLRAAAEGRLRTPVEVAEQARRMLPDPRTKSKLRYFLHQWLQVERAYDVSKDPGLYPDFDPRLVSDALTSLDLLLDHVIWSQPSDFRQLLLADYMFANERLAEFYSLDRPQSAAEDFALTPCTSQPQAGVLTHPYLMIGFAYHKASSPIHRGVFLVRSVLGRSLKPPPIAVAPLDEGDSPEMTTRERVALQTKPAMCQTCHSLINPLGFSLESFDAVGRLRSQELDKPIDARGSYETIRGDRVEFDGARELAEFLASCDEVHGSFAEQLFQNIVKQPVQAYGTNTLEELQSEFAAADFNVQRLLVAILQRSALETNPPPDPSGE
jgi:hypothetical protein